MPRRLGGVNSGRFGLRVLAPAPFNRGVVFLGAFCHCSLASAFLRLVLER